jgi:hypothetical protein
MLHFLIVNDMCLGERQIYVPSLEATFDPFIRSHTLRRGLLRAGLLSFAERFP